jgi:hypothetical protein
MTIIAPRHDRAIVLKRERMQISGGHLYYVLESVRYVDLAKAIVAPRHHGAVGLERE